jgi:hypothetical protein
MREKKFRLNMRGQGAQVAVVPSREDVFEQAWGGALGVPRHTKAIPIGHPGRLGGCQALLDDRMLLVKDQVFQVNLWTCIGNPSAHGNLPKETNKGLRSTLSGRQARFSDGGAQLIWQTAETDRQRP